MTPAVPETNGGVGTSFKGTAAYLLHDVDARTQERVAWVETRNLASSDPEIAWRLMAATAMDSERLKRLHHEREQAQLPKDDRTAYRASKPSKNHVFHYALSWHPDEEMALSREEMLRAANASIRELGGDHLQAMIVCHRDKDHAHVHVMLSRIDPQTGRTAPVDGNAQRHLSRFALKYERERGEIRCPQREIHAEMRKRGLPYVAEKRVPRLVFEQMRAAEADAKVSPERLAQARERQRQKDAVVSKQGRDLQDRHRRQWDRLSRDHRFRKAMINDQADEAKAQAVLQITKADAPVWTRLQKRQTEERRRLEANERSLRGRLQNTAAALKSLWSRNGEGNPPRRLMGQSFGVLAHAGARREALADEQERQKQALAKAQRDKTADAKRTLEAERKRAIAENFKRYQGARGELMFTQKGEQAAQRSRWATRDADRAEAWRGLVSAEQMRQAHQAAARAENMPSEPKRENRGVAPRSRPRRTRTRK